MDFPNSFTNLQNPENMGGTTGTKKYKNSKKGNNEWIVKRSEKGAGGWAQVQSEAMANEIYKVCGIPVPAQKLYPDAQALVLEFKRGIPLNQCKEWQKEKLKVELAKGFVVDALLANWDVIGLTEDNIIVDDNGNGTPFRIDNGGSLQFRAQGERKEFGPEVKELETMRKTTKQHKFYFGALTEDYIKGQIQKIIKPNRTAILAATSPELKEVMEKRIDYMLNYSSTWMNETQFVNSKEETPANEGDTFLVEQAIVDFFWTNWNANYDTFTFANANSNNAGISTAAHPGYAVEQKRRNKLLRYVKHLLKTHKAKISGGFLLKAMGKFQGGAPSYDIDIYVPHANVEPFRTEMGTLFLGHAPIMGTDYVQHQQGNGVGGAASFFTKNGILSVRKHHRGVEGTPTYEEMDIVEANTTTSPIGIIKNFDLTFCQNWYDGEQVWLTHAEHVISKHGLLEDHYLELLYINKAQTIGRIRKYAGRGFRVNINNPITHLHEDITDKILAGQTVNYSAATAAAKAAATTAAKTAPAPDDEIKKAHKEYLDELSKFGEKYPHEANHTANNVKKDYAPVHEKYKVWQELKKKLLDPQNATGQTYLHMPQRRRVAQPINQRNVKRQINTRNARPNANPNNFRPNAVPEPTEAFEQFLLDNPVNPPFNSFESQCRDQWAGAGYVGLNAFLQGTTARNLGYDYTKFLTPYFPQEPGESVEQYTKRKLYYFFVNLYNVVQRGPAYSQVFKVYRGTRTWYLKEEPAKTQFYYLSAFAATSTSKNVANGFGGGKCYVFYVHPSCRYVSFRRNETDAHSEKEVLLTPYHRYLYVKEVRDATNIYKIFLIFPTDIEIPNTFNTYMPWKEGIAERTRNLQGGSSKRKSKTQIKRNRNKSRSKRNGGGGTKKNSQQNLSSNLKNLVDNKSMQHNSNTDPTNVKNNSNTDPTNGKNNLNVDPTNGNNNNQRSVNSEQNSLKDYEQTPEDNRFTDAISSFKGAQATTKEMEMAAKMVKFFENNPI
jgi:hypothetical protein